MQHGLLGLGLALIAAIVAALAAPLFVDWNAWRPEFERRASMVVGAPVAIRGPIEASILPQPAFVMKDVTVGDPMSGTGLKAGQIRGNLSLGALFRGAVEAETIVLTKPLMRLTLDAGGRIVTNATGDGPAPLSISKFTVESGVLTIDDRAHAKQFHLADVSLAGELQSRNGPLKLDGKFTERGKIWNLRTSTGEFGGGKGKLRLSLSHPDGVVFDADGMLSLAKAFPGFEGKINFSQPGMLPLKFAANATASNALLTLDDLEVSLGGGDTPATLSGTARIDPLKRGMVDAQLSAKFIDLDRAEGAQNQSIAESLAPLREILGGMNGNSLTGKLKLTIAQVVAGGGNVRDLDGVFSFGNGTISPERFDARLPGRGAVSVKGMPTRDGSFKGQWTVSAEEPAALAEWTGLLPPEIAGNGAFKLDGGLSLAGGRLTLDPFLLSLGDTRLGGQVVFEPAEGQHPANLNAKLNGTAVDIALLLPTARKALERKSPLDIHAVLDIRAPRILGQTAGRLQTDVARTAAGVALDRLAIDDLGGLSIAAHGDFASYPEKPKGKIEFTVEGKNPSGLNELAKIFAGPEMSAYVKRVSAAAMPLRIEGAINGDGAGPLLGFEAKGQANQTQFLFTSRGNPQAFSLDAMQLSLTSPDASGLVALLGLPAPEPQAGQGHFEISLGKKEKDAAPLKASLVFPGINLAGEGVLQFGKNGRVDPRVNLKLAATDFRALSIAAARTSNAIIPAKGTARLIRADGGIALEDLAVDFGETHVRGRVAMKGVEQPALSGELAVNRSDLATLLTLALGRAGEGAPWSDQPLGVIPLDGASGDFSFESASFGLGGNLAATGVRTRVRFGDNRVSIEDLTGDLAGGKLTAHARVSRPDLISFDGGFSLKEADLARLASPYDWRSSVRGKGDISLDLAGQGASPAQLATSVAGRGTFSMKDFEIEKLAPGALGKVLASTSAAVAPDEAGVRALLAKEMEEAPFKLAKLEGPIVAANGIIRTGKTTIQSKGIAITPELSLDLAKLNLDGSAGFESAPPKGMNVRPSVTVGWRGPLEKPVKSIEIGPLMAVISLRTMDGLRKSDMREGAPQQPPSIPAVATESPLAPKSKPRRKTPPAAPNFGLPLPLNSYQ